MKRPKEPKIKDPHGILARVDWQSAQLAQNYVAARIAIQQCESVDELLNIQDRMTALAAYYKQVKDYSLELAAKRIRLRAARQCGKILLQISPDLTPRRSKGRFAGVCSARADAAKAAGLTRPQGNRLVALARVSEPVFEAAVESDNPPSPESFCYPTKTSIQIRLTEQFRAEFEAVHALWIASEGLTRVQESCEAAFGRVLIEIALPIMRARLERGQQAAE